MPDVRERERAHLGGHRAVPLLAQREPGGAERLLEVAVEARAVEGGGGRGHAEAAAAAPAEAARRARTPSRAARRRGSMLAGLQQQAGHRERELRVAVQHLVGDLARPACASALPEPLTTQPSQCSPIRSAASCQSARRHRVARALERLAVGRVPAARRAVQGGQLLRETVPELGAEHLRKQRVVAEPCARRVERVDEPVRSRSSSPSGGRPSETPVSASDQLGVHPLDDRGPEQEPAASSSS